MTLVPNHDMINKDRGGIVMNDHEPLPIKINENGDIVPNYMYELWLIEQSIKALIGK